MNRGRVAVATCARLPEIDADDAPVVAPLARYGIEAVPAVWDDPDVDWTGFDLTVVRSTWDYWSRRDDFLDWAGQVPRLANPVDVLAWNTDKRYLAELTAAGLPVVPTTWLSPGDRWEPPTEGHWVVKPAVSAGSRDAGRYHLADPAERGLAIALVARLHQAGRVVMVQPYVKAVDDQGETALVFLGGRYSHAIRKGAMLDGPYTGMDALYKPETISARTASVAERSLAEQVLAAIPYPAESLLYARVDLLPGPDGPMLIELELAEPSIFLRHDDGAGDRFADAIVAHLQR